MSCYFWVQPGYLSALNTRTPIKTKVSMRAGKALQNPKTYQNLSQSHSSRTNMDREIAALEWAAMESKLAVPLNMEQPPRNPPNSKPRNTRVRDKPTINSVSFVENSLSVYWSGRQALTFTSFDKNMITVTTKWAMRLKNLDATRLPMNILVRNKG